MTKKKLPVRFTGQHFTIDKVLIKDAIRQANISNQDTVYVFYYTFIRIYILIKRLSEIMC